MNILLVFVPLAIVSSSLKWVEWLTFVFSLLSLCPLAERLGYATEQMAMYTNNTIGGLLNASFGNATELVVALYALTGGQLRVVQLSLLGSILSNMLLVLGFAFFLGGLRYKTQRFAKEGATASSRLLLLSMFGLLLPNMLHVTHTELRDGFDTLALSRQCSIVLIGMYGAFLYFQLVSHRELYEPKENEQDEDEEDDDDEPVLGFWGAMVWLAILTVFAAILSGFVVETIDVAAKQIGLSIGFISTILLPIVGNASDHAASVMFAMKNKMDISLGVAIGSSTQIGMCVIPLLVLVAWALHIPLALDFHAFETGVLFSSVVVVCLCIQDGQSNWLQGLTLILVYVVVGIAFFHHDDPEALISTDPGA